MHAKAQIDIRPVRQSDAESLYDAINSVAAEKWLLATVRFSLDEIRAFLERSIENSQPHVLALDGDEVLGWCVIVPGKIVNGFGHVGQLAMGVRQEWRRRGIGRDLLDACLRQALIAAIEKVELEVYADNEPAVRLYESFGFVREGLKARARKLEERYQDILLMALWVDQLPTVEIPQLAESGGAPDR